MALYKYEHLDHAAAAKNGCEAVFEVLQDHKEAPLEVCPKCGQACRRMFNFRVSSVRSERDTLSPKNLAAHGFTQYKKAGGGYYEKTAGEGPKVISADEAAKLQSKGL